MSRLLARSLEIAYALKAIWAAHPPKKIVSSKVRAFMAFYAEVIGELSYWDDGLALELQT